MARDDAPPFERGGTFYAGGSIDSANLGGDNLLGKIYVFEDIDLTATTTGAKQVRSGQPVKVMAVRNQSAGALLPKRLVTLRRVAGKYTGEVDGYADVTAEADAFPVDEFLPSAGVPQYDIFYIVIEGPAMCMTDLAGGANNLIAIGDALVALTAATSGATTSGRVKPQDLTGATAVLGAELQNKIGRALSAKTTAQTNGDVLVNIRRW